MIIKIPSRLHITLIDLSQNGYRRNGGIGFTVEDPFIEIFFSKNKETDISFLKLKNINKSLIENIIEKIEKTKKKYSLKHSIKINNCNYIYSHHGFGSGTSITLACLEALFLINGITPTEDLLKKNSGRGGTSGIGIHTYFNGGFAFDIGHSNLNQDFQSSDSIKYEFETPILFKSFAMPDWEIGIAIPKNNLSISLFEENYFFEKNTPIDSADVFQTSYHSVFGATASALTNNYPSFCKSINSIQKTYWKKKEIEIYGDFLNRTINKLMDHGCDAVGMSSIGPCLYFFAENIDSRIDYLKSNIDDFNFIKTKPNNKGRSICLN